MDRQDKNAALKSDIRAVISKAIEAASPEPAVERHLQIDGNTLYVGDRACNLSKYRRIAIVGAGKATAGMTRAVTKLLRTQKFDGVISVRDLPKFDIPGIEIIRSGHPVPDRESMRTAKSTLKLARELTEQDLAICLISGGASALWSAPSGELTLSAKAETTEALLACGAEIHETNCIRKHLSAIKGGRLAEAVSPATLVTLAISDVVGDDPSSIGSGPTVGDQTTFADALEVVRKYRLSDQLPTKVISHLESGARGNLSESPKPDNSLFDNSAFHIIASNMHALKATSEGAIELGYKTEILESTQTGEASEVGAALARKAIDIQRHLSPDNPPLMLITGGETTVTLKGNGKGGRNQELALAAALELQGTSGIVFASIGTDGSDGPTDAAGGIVDGSTVQRASAAGLDVRAHLANNDSYPLLDAIGDLMRIGPTGTNVMDIQIAGIRGI